MIELRRLSDSATVEEYAPQMARWIFESGPKFFEYLHGSEEAAITELQKWSSRANSEFSGMLATFIFSDGEAAGILIAVPGPEIPTRRRADLLALIRDVAPTERAALQAKLQRLSELTQQAEPEDFYIRTVAVDVSQRGCGLGRKLVECAIADGRAAGFSRIRLDVDSDNKAALSLYGALGFETIFEGAAPDTGLRMKSLLLSLH